MQTPKSRTGSLEVPRRSSPATARNFRQLKTPASDSDSVPSPANRMPKDRNHKIVERKSPRSLASEQRKCPGRISDLESQITRLQEELKTMKDQLSSSESLYRRSQQENEESEKQLIAMSTKLEESRQQILELSASEDARIQELRKISQDRDRAWQSELEAVQKHHSVDSAALATAMNEIQKLKTLLDRMAASEAAYARCAESAYAEVQSLRVELTEAHSLIENLTTQLNDCKESEAQALDIVCNIEKELSLAKTVKETSRAKGLKVMEACKSIVMELEQSNNKVSLLEGLVCKFQADIANDSSRISVDPTGNNAKAAEENDEHKETNLVKTELNNLKSDVGQLRSALGAAERRYQEEYIHSTLQIRSAYELVELTKSESSKREAELESKFTIAKADVEALKGLLKDKETRLKTILEVNQGTNLKFMESQSILRESNAETELKTSEVELNFLKESLLDKEIELQNITGENEMLKLDIKKGEIETNDETLTLAEVVRATEGEALMKIGHLTVEADKSSKEAVQVIEQLVAARVANSEMEAELRRLKVQLEQWRKAAEAAAAMLSTDNNGNFVERAGSLDYNYHTIDGKLGLPYSEDMDDDLIKKKNLNMLQKIGVLLKKGQK